MHLNPLVRIINQNKATNIEKTHFNKFVNEVKSKIRYSFFENTFCRIYNKPSHLWEEIYHFDILSAKYFLIIVPLA